MTTSPDLQSRLALAANRGDLDECRRLLAAGADPAFADADQFTPMHEAAQGGHPAVCALLIEAGASLDAVDKTRNTPLHEDSRRAVCVGGPSGRLLHERDNHRSVENLAWYEWCKLTET